MLNKCNFNSGVYAQLLIWSCTEGSKTDPMNTTIEAEKIKARPIVGVVEQQLDTKMSYERSYKNPVHSSAPALFLCKHKKRQGHLWALIIKCREQWVVPNNGVFEVNT